jgi:hypothetical protein
MLLVLFKKVFLGVVKILYSLFQTDLMIIEPLLATVILIVIMLFSTYFYLKTRNWIIETVIFLFSLIIGAIALSVPIPMYPYFQMFFLIYQTIIFILTSLQMYERFKQ